MLQLLILISTAILVAFDQFTKWLALTNLQGNPPLSIIDGVFELSFTTNTGVAFGMFKNYQIIFIIITTIALLGLLVVLMSGRMRRYKIVTVSGTMILAGGVGNLIDRVFRHEVVDFLSFKAINFPIFNVADCFVVIGAALLLIFFLFIYSDDKSLEKDKKTELPLCKTMKEEKAADGNSNADTTAGQDGGEA